MASTAGNPVMPGLHGLGPLFVSFQLGAQTINSSENPVCVTAGTSPSTVTQAGTHLSVIVDAGTSESTIVLASTQECV